MGKGGSSTEPAAAEVNAAGAEERKPVEVYLFGKRVDVSKFMRTHPGGTKALKIFADRDATEQFIMCALSDRVARVGGVV